MERQSKSMLEIFCISNKDKIVSCAWIDSKYCMKTCKYYAQKKPDLKKEYEKVR